MCAIASNGCYWPHCDSGLGFNVTSALPLKAAGQAFRAILSACDPEETFAATDFADTRESKLFRPIKTGVLPCRHRTMPERRPNRKAP